MDKKVVTAFGKKVYLLGIDNDGIYRWLEEPSWDCGWYWGFGYIESYTINDHPERSKDINEHTHFDTLFINRNGMIFDNFKKFFKETPLSDPEIWELCDYMKTYYTLREAAEVFRHGYSWQTERASIPGLKDKNLSDKINNNFLPKLFDRVRELLTPKSEKLTQEEYDLIKEVLE